MYTVALARTQGRASIVVVEELDEYGVDRPVRVVRLAARLAQDARPEDVYDAVIAAADAVKPDNGGEEARIIVLADAVGSVVAAILRDEYRLGHRERRATVVTTAASSRGSGASYVSRNRLASTLYAEWKARRVAFTSREPELDRLRSEVTRFAPRETPAGVVQFGEQVNDMDDAVVALALGVLVRGRGPVRYADGEGGIWPSFEEARARIGGRL